MSEATNRRGFLNRTLRAAAGAGTALSIEECTLLAALQDGTSQQQTAKPSVDPHRMPRGMIGKVSISRLFLGGNLIGGWAHSRDMRYISQLFRAYNTREKIFATLELAEQCGINTVLVDPRDWAPVLKYQRERKGKIQTMVCVTPVEGKDALRDQIKQLVDAGATLLYTHGEATDLLTRAGRIDAIGTVLDLVKQQGLPAGIGSHSLETPSAAEKNHLNPDFYVKTFHKDEYWSATPKQNRQEWCWYDGRQADHGQYHDNIWCLDPEKTAAFMEQVGKPWVAFKVMAAGAIHPRMAFPSAYRHGADFIVAGMFDFQIEQDVRIAVEALGKTMDRKRPWHG